MSDIILSRRRFLVGSAASALAIPGARLLQAAPMLAPTVPDLSARSGYIFDVLPTWQEAMLETPEHKLGLVDVVVRRSGNAQLIQVERGMFATTFIPTSDGPRTREADSVSLDFTACDTTRNISAVITNARRTPTYAVINSKLHRFEPGESRFIPGEGLLVEEQRTNVVPYTDPEGTGSAYVWTSQTLRLRPGRHTLTWYGQGHVSVVGDRVWIAMGQ